MCLEMMDTETTRFPKPECVRHGFPATWTPFCDPAAVKWAFQQNRNAATVQKHQTQEQRLAQRAKLGPFVTTSEKKRKRRNIGFRNGEANCTYLPAGGMAPRNTTQYLMSNVYEDMKMDATIKSNPHELSGHIYLEGLSPSNVSEALDSCFEDILQYQLRDFEELYDLICKPE